MPTSPRRFFLCTGEVVEYAKLYEHPNSHILGELRYLTEEGRRVTAMAYYTTPVSAAEVPPIKPDICVHLIGDARMIKCRFDGCSHMERWEIGKAAFMVLMDRYKEVAEKTVV